jgi:Sulfotransferase family
LQKKLIYIVGCGRSGSTILGIALGNSAGALDLGELIDFAHFKGKPNEFGPETENYKYWQNILGFLAGELGKLDFKALRQTQKDVDSHTSFVPIFLLGAHYRKKSYLMYQKYLKALYDAIQWNSKHNIFITASKYPSSLLHLIQIYTDTRIYVIHLIRNPTELAQAFRNPEQGKTKSFWGTMRYFFIINFFSILAARRVSEDRYLRVHYDDLISAPESVLTQIGASFKIDTSPAISKISKDEPLDRGYLFNGNRMRMQSQVVFRKQSPQNKAEKPTLVEFALERLATLMFGDSNTTECRTGYKHATPTSECASSEGWPHK